VSCGWRKWAKIRLNQPFRSVHEGVTAGADPRPRVAGYILIVDDELDLVRSLEFNLEREGYRTASALTGQAGLDLAAREPVPDLILLDLMLPDLPGTEVCRRLRTSEATAAIPVVMITAKDDEIDRVVGFELGADDYVAKPFSIREVLLRVKAILRRTQLVSGDLSEVRCGDLKVDMAGHRVWVGDDETSLTALEFRLLTTFLSRRGRVQTRDALLQDVWGLRPGVTTRTVDTHVQRLRKKLGIVGGYIETLRGVGYRFHGQGEALVGAGVAELARAP